MFRKVLIAFAALLLAAPMVRAGWLSEAVNEAVENTGRRKVQEKVDEAVDTADEKAHEIGQGSTEEEAAPVPKKGKAKAKVEPQEEEQASGGETSGSETSGGQAVEGEAPKGGPSKGGVAATQPEEKMYRNYDFVPGEKIIFFDDFSDTDVGEFPPRWTFEGPSGGGGAVEIVQYGDKRYFHSQTIEGEWGQNATTVYIRLKDLNDLPKKFTVEFDAILGKLNGQSKIYGLLLVQEGSPIDYYNPGQVYFEESGAASKNNKTSYEKDDGKLHHFSIMVNGTFMKAYVDGERVINDPDGVARPITYVDICFWPEGANRQDKLMITNFRLAEGGKDIPKALETDGRIVTHGITFDTGSEKIKPESYPTLKTIYDLLVGDPKLKFRIEGHTDNVGNTKANQTLSEKRAASVMAWMTKKGLAPDRFKTDGFGDTKPLSKNDTPEGRANNRRVEFVKI